VGGKGRMVKALDSIRTMYGLCQTTSVELDHTKEWRSASDLESLAKGFLTLTLQLGDKVN
jgi:hypothetical protein